MKMMFVNGRLSVIPPLSLRKWQGRDGEEETDGPDGPADQLFLKLTRARICIYILEKNWSIGPI